MRGLTGLGLMGHVLSIFVPRTRADPKGFTRMTTVTTETNLRTEATAIYVDPFRGTVINPAETRAASTEREETKTKIRRGTNIGPNTAPLGIAVTLCAVAFSFAAFNFITAIAG